jgi:MFS family permease
VVALLCVAGVLSALLARSLSSRAAMLAGLALLLPGLALLPAAEAQHSFVLLLTGAVITGPATMLGYRGSLQVLNEIAPAEQRGEITASYILCCYAGNSLPIVGIGLLSSVVSSLIADTSFAALIAGLALLALITGARRLRR